MAKKDSNKSLKLRVKLHETEREIRLLQQEIAQVIDQRNNLIQQLENYRRVPTQIKLLVVNVHCAIMARVEWLNQPGKRYRAMTMRPVPIQADRQRVAAAALRYDKRALRESRIFSGMFREALYFTIKFADRQFIRLAKKSIRGLKRLKRKVHR